MPFVVPLAIAAGGAFAGSKLAGGGGGSKNSPGSSGSIDPEIRRLLGIKEGQASFAFDMAKDLLPKSQQTMQAPIDYWMKLLSGDQQAMQEAIAPEAGRIISQYDTASKAVRELAPRSGQRAGSLSDISFRKLSDVASLTAGVRPKAADALSGLGGQQAALATALLSGSGSDLNSILQTLLGTRGQDIQQSTANRQMWGDLGQGVGSIIASLLLGMNKNKG
jgi:predicted ATPase